MRAETAASETAQRPLVCVRSAETLDGVVHIPAIIIIIIIIIITIILLLLIIIIALQLW